MADIRTYGKVCHGTKVLRCLWFNVDHTNKRVRPYAAIIDAHGGYRVAVTNLWLEKSSAGQPAWRMVNNTREDDADGYHENRDNAYGGLGSCIDGVSYRARALFEWQGSPSGFDYHYSTAVYIRC